MSEGLLPRTVNTRKAVTSEARYDGVLGPAQLGDFTGEKLVDPKAEIVVRIVFGRDEEDRQIAEVSLSADVEMQCQRCLQAFRLPLESHSQLALVRSDDEAKGLPARYEPLIVDDDIDLWSVVGEELALALPVVSYHPEGECPGLGVEPGVVEAGAEAEESGKNVETRRPFAGLSALMKESSDDRGGH